MRSRFLESGARCVEANYRAALGAQFPEAGILALALLCCVSFFYLGLVGFELMTLLGGNTGIASN